MKTRKTISILATALALFLSMMLADSSMAQIGTGGPPIAATGANTRFVPPGP